MEADNRSCDAIPDPAELPSVADCRKTDGLDESLLVGVPVMVSVDPVAGVEEVRAMMDVEVKTEVQVIAKRKRGRPPKGQAKQLQSKRNKKEDEDVCFICFDGGSLVLCDRRDCPKAYHPACIKRDEAFFRSRAKWNCGWHICSRCQKASHYMCYTCTYSLCKACTKGADYVCVRQNKGFCSTCMGTIMLIEKTDQGSKETAQVDFDDKSSWEYLFKVYWIYLKEKLSLTLEELTQAQNPWKAAGMVTCKKHLLDVPEGVNKRRAYVSDGSSGLVEAHNSVRKINEQPKPKLAHEDHSPSTDKPISDNGSREWASKQLLEFVAHMRNGDTSVLSQLDVQALLLDYVKRNNLRDPQQKSQIICDLRLRNLFGKLRLGHIEMLKLLEFHFLAQEEYQRAVTEGNVLGAVVSQVEVDGNNDNLPMMVKDKKRKSRRKGEERGRQPNPDEYAAIDVHNINLIYLHRNLMENLIMDEGKFHDKVVGSFVRIRIPSSDQKEDMYRLVQVVGTCEVAVPYKIGERTANVMLEILNLHKKETIAIDAISNQEFSEDECRRLRQSIKYGLVKWLTVGQVQEKAVALQEVRFDNWLETETVRLSHLRDRASEMGHKKEYPFLVKLELLKTPQERQCRLTEIPEVHVDPTMDPNCESDEDAGVISNKKQDEYVNPKCSGLTGDGEGPICSGNGYTTNDHGSRVLEKLGSNTMEKSGIQVDSSGPVGGCHSGPRSGSLPGAAPETSVASLPSGGTPSVNDGETDLLWHYRDPNGKIQGPFCMMQLRKWSTTGYFPSDMRIWSITDEEVGSLLLTDVLKGQLPNNVLPLAHDSTLPFQEIKGASSGGINSPGTDGKQSESDAVTQSNGDNEFLKGNERVPVTNNSDPYTENSSHCRDSPNGNSSDKPQVHNPVSSSPLTEWSYGISLPQAAKGQDGKQRNSALDHGNGSSHGNMISLTTGGQNHENQSNIQGYSGQSSEESRRPGPSTNSLNNCSSNASFASVTKSTDSSEQNVKNEIPNLPASPMPKTSSTDLDVETPKDQHLGPSSVPVQDLSIQNLPVSTPEQSDGDDKKANSSIGNIRSPTTKADNDENIQTTESKQPVSLNFPVQHSGPTWSGASSPVVSFGTQLPRTADEWRGYSSTHAKPSVEEWDAGLLSLSSLKPPEASNHVATLTSKCNQPAPSPSPPASNASTWQGMVAEPIEFSTLAEESVSDLLAEVDAMESQCDFGSPTSKMNYIDELFEDSKNDCFNPLEGLSPPIDSGKSDSSSSTGAIQLPPQPSVTNEHLTASPPDAPDPVKDSGWKSPTSTEPEVEKKPTVPDNRLKVCGLNGQLPVSSTVSQEMIHTGIPTNLGPKPVITSSGAMQGSINSGWGGSTQGITNIGSGTVQGPSRGNANMSRSTSAGIAGRENNPRFGGESNTRYGGESHPRYGGERSTGQRDRAFQSGDSGFGKGRQSFSRQPSYGGSGGAGGGSYSRPPPSKGQRVCKFYENGYCRKGAFCDYLHP